MICTPRDHKLMRDFEEYYRQEVDSNFRMRTHKIVCPRCKGEGKHVNPAIDGNGISADDECWQDDDFREAYFGGRYDVTCEECSGKNVVDELDEDSLTDEQRKEWEQYQADAWESYDIQKQEMMMEGSW